MQRFGVSEVRAVALVVFLAVAAVAGFRALADYHFEDSYITYRYAANLAEGHGFVFQPGERVLGTSTPFYTLLLAFLGLLGLDVAVAGGWIYMLALVTTGGLGARLLSRRGVPNAGVWFAICAALGFGGSVRFFGMETTLYAALIFATVALAAQGRPWATGVALGLVCTTRYDGVVVAGAVLLCRLLATRRLPWREAAVSGTMLGSWLLFAQLYFGSPLPNTLGAKSADIGFVDYLAGSLERQYLLLFDPLMRLGPWRWVSAHVDLHGVLVFLLVLGLLAALVRGAMAVPRILRGPRLEDGAEGEGAADGVSPGGALTLAPLGLFAVLLWLGYAVIGPPVVHTWYQVPPVLALLALSLATWGRWLGRVVPGTVAAVAAIAGLGLAAVLVPTTMARQAEPLVTGAGYWRIHAYDQFADWIEDHGMEDTTLFTREPGYLTYRTRQSVIDGAGLVTPGIFFHGPEDRRTDLPELFDERRPELAILSSRVARQPGYITSDHLPVVHAQPIRTLWMRRDAFSERFDGLYESWLGRTYLADEDVSPLADVDFEPGTPPPGWAWLGGWRGGRPLENLVFEGRPVEGGYLQTYGEDTTETIWSHPFPIDFDQLHFRFAANHPTLTVAQLFVDGQLVFEIGGRPGELTTLYRIELPMFAWRGRTGVLRFVDEDRGDGFLVADRVGTRRFPRSTPFEDFESAADGDGGWGSTWRKTFDGGPAPSAPLAMEHGLHMAQGRFLASSLGLPGPQLLESEPFVVDHDRLSFTVYDFGSSDTRVELRVAGHRKHLFQGGTRRGLGLVTWDLSPLRGRQAVLIVRDDDADPKVGIGVDSIQLYDLAPR